MPSLDVITGKSDPAVQRIIDVTKPARSAVRTALIEDAEPLLQGLRAGLVFLEIYGIEGHPFPEELLAECRRRDIPVRLIAVSVANQVFKGEKRPKTFGIARVPPPRGWEDLEAGKGDLVVLDGVKIVGNIGAIVRTSFALGAGGIVLVDSDLATVADRRLVRASRGYVFSLPVVLASRSEAAVQLHGSGMRIVAFDAGGQAAVDDLTDVPQRLALLFGGEKHGASRELAAADDVETVGIAINPGAESLNVSVCAGIALHARARRNLAAR